MLQILVEPIIYLLIISPLIIISFNRDKKNIKAILIFFIYYIVYNLISFSPQKLEVLKFYNGIYNWSGKVYGTLFTILAYLILKKDLKHENYFTIKQKKGSKTLTLILIFAPIIIIFLSNIFFHINQVFSIEDLLFQLSLPGIDEEMAYRGIILGLLSVSLNKQFKIGRLSLGNSGLLITSILFGLAHGLQVKDNWEISIVYSQIFLTGALGYLWGLITYYSRSFLGSIISHNILNTCGFLTRVLF